MRFSIVYVNTAVLEIAMLLRYAGTIIITETTIIKLSI